MSTGLQTTLLILLAAGYLILLLLCIVVIVIVIRILQSVRNIAKKAENTTDNLAEVAKTLGKRLAPVAISSLVGMIMKKVRNKRKFEEE